MFWTLGPVIKNPFFYLSPGKFILTWTGERRWQVRDSYKMASGPTCHLEKQNKFWLEGQLLSSPPPWPSRAGGTGRGGNWEPLQPAKTHSCDLCLGTGVIDKALARPAQVTGGEERSDCTLLPHPEIRVCSVKCCLPYKKTYPHKQTPVRSPFRELASSARKLQ